MFFWPTRLSYSNKCIIFLLKISLKVRHAQIKEDNFKLDLARVDYWLSKGAKPSTTVASLIRRAKNPNLKPHHAVKAKKTEAKKEA